MIPSSIKNIGTSAFYGCESLSTIYYKGTIEDWNEIDINDYNENLSNATLYFYLQEEPTDGNHNYWYYDENEKIKIWNGINDDSNNEENDDDDSEKMNIVYELSNDGMYYIITGIKDITCSEIILPSYYNNLPIRKIAANVFVETYYLYYIIFEGSKDEWNVIDIDVSNKFLLSNNIYYYLSSYPYFFDNNYWYYDDYKNITIWQEQNLLNFEWYTTDNIMQTENDAIGIENFIINSSTFKALGQEHSFENISGEIISTSKGFKLNSSTRLSIIANIDYTLTLYVCPINENYVCPLIETDTGILAELISGEFVDDGTAFGVYKYVFSLSANNTWNIRRGSNSETSAILYARCDYVL